MSSTERNVAVLKRLRDLLVRQRGKLREYLRLLECEGQSIERGDAAGLVAQVEMEQSLIADIGTLRKVIEPLEGLYRAAYPAGTESTVPRLREALEAMGGEIADHHARNRRRLEQRMQEVRGEISSLRTWPKDSSFSPATRGLIDITT